MVKLLAPGLLSNMLGMPRISQIGLKYLLRDEFTTALTAGNVDGTAAEPGPGTRAVVDTGGNLAISGGNVSFAGRTDTGDPGIWLDSISRQTGLVLLFHINMSTVGRFYIGEDDNQVSFPSGSGVATFHVRAGSGLRVVVSGVDTVVAPILSSNTDYYLSVVHRNSGTCYFIKGGIYTNWTLLFYEADNDLAAFSPVLSMGATNSVATSSYMRVPDDLWLPAPVVSDGFTAANGTSLDAHSTDGAGHAESSGLGSGGDGLSWTEENGDWDIQSNRANAVTPDSGPPGAAAVVDAGVADVLINCTIEMDATDSTGVLIRYLDNNNLWWASANAGTDIFEIYERNAATNTQRASAAVTVNGDTDYSLRAIAYGQTIDAYLDGANKISYASAALNETKTKHGLHTRNNAGSYTYDNFVIYPRGTGGEFSALDAY